MVSFFLAGVFCVVASRRASGGAGKGLWRFLAVYHGLYTIDILLNLRHKSHDFLRDVWANMGLWAGRRPYQAAVESAIAVVALIVLFMLLHRLTTLSRGTRLALIGTLLSAFLYALEVVSLHFTDRVMYLQVGPILLIALGWVAACGMVVAASVSGWGGGR